MSTMIIVWYGGGKENRISQGISRRCHEGGMGGQNPSPSPFTKGRRCGEAWRDKQRVIRGRIGWEKIRNDWGGAVKGPL